MKVFKIYGQDYFDAMRQKEFPLAVQNKLINEVDRVKNDVEEQLNKPRNDNPIVVSKLQKVFPTQKEITYEGNIRKARHAAKIQQIENS